MSRLVRTETRYFYDDGSATPPNIPPAPPVVPPVGLPPVGLPPVGTPTPPVDPPAPPADPPAGSPAPGQTIYISPTGNDANPGTSPGLPWKSLDYAETFGGSFKGMVGTTFVLMDGVHYLKRHLRYFASLFVKGDGITFRAMNRGMATVKIAPTPVGSVPRRSQGDSFSFQANNITVDGIVFDGEYKHRFGTTTPGVSNFKLLNCELKNFKGHAFRPNGARNVLIENTSITNCLWWSPGAGRRDAHALSAEGIVGLTVRNCSFGMVSGDCIQIQDKSTDITVEDTDLWNGPITQALSDATGFPVGQQPGENAIDTKQNRGLPYQVWTLKNVKAFGWRQSDYMTNAAAFNFKENAQIDADGIEVYDSEIAFRCRGETDKGGPAKVSIRNSEIYRVVRPVRYEDGIGANLIIDNTEFGPADLWFQKAPRGTGNFPIVTNCKFQGAALPAEALAATGADKNVLIP